MLIKPLRAASPNESWKLARLQIGVFERPWSAADIARIIGQQTGFAIIAGGDMPLGFALVNAPVPEADLLIVVVDHAYRGQGFGRALVEAAAAGAAARGAEVLDLEVAEDNDAARALYEQLGFREIGRRKDYYRRAEGSVAARVLRLAL